MKQSELRRALKEEFGEAYAQVVIRDHWLREFGATPADLIAAGQDVRSIWLAICEDFEVPEKRRHGRGMLSPKKF